MKRNINILALSIMAILVMAGCGDSTQREVIHALFEPFSLPENPASRERFRNQLKKRAKADPDSKIIEYEFIPMMIRESKDDFCDSICARVVCIISDPTQGTLILGEDWYFSLETVDPLLLRRRVVSEDKKDYIYESWATETKLNANRAVDDRD